MPTPLPAFKAAIRDVDSEDDTDLVLKMFEVGSKKAAEDLNLPEGRVRHRFFRTLSRVQTKFPSIAAEMKKYEGHDRET